jgi:hypothetical protein
VLPPTDSRVRTRRSFPLIRIIDPALADPQDQQHRPPSRRRTGPAWSQFLRSQAEAILARGFLPVDLLDGTQAYALAVIEHTARRIRILGVTLHPTGAWTA